MKILLATAAVLAMIAPSHAAQWKYQFKSAPLPTVEIAPLQYGKTWAYALEIDDNPASTIEVSQPLLAQFQWDDAPPGVAGGVKRPFVGTAAVSFSGANTTNPTYLNLAQLQQLQADGWDIVNHSYWHTGNHWDASQFLKPEDFRRELFWSQLFYATMVGNGRGSTHFVYPSGDYHYGPYLKEFGLLSASRVGATSPHNLFDAKWNPLDLDRNYLDEGAWAEQKNVLAGLPDAPQAGDFLIDFTHGMNADAASQNHKDWLTRLAHIAENYGSKGDNSVWVAPTDAVVNYHLAASKAKFSVTAGAITVDLPDDAPASALTLVIGGLNAQSQLPVPAGGTLYRQGRAAWLTTPIIGTPGAALAAPKLKQIYSGPVTDLKWDKPEKIAGVRLLQSAPVAENYNFQLQIETPDGALESLVPDGSKLEQAWGTWRLFPTIPDRAAPAAHALKVAPDPNLRQMEVWAIAP